MDFQNSAICTPFLPDLSLLLLQVLFIKGGMFILVSGDLACVLDPSSGQTRAGGPAPQSPVAADSGWHFRSAHRVVLSVVYLLPLLPRSVLMINILPVSDREIERLTNLPKATELINRARI